MSKCYDNPDYDKSYNPIQNVWKSNNIKETMNRQLVYNAIQTPDGTILVSRHRHDYVYHTDENGFEYMVDGGNDYQRTISNPTAPHTDVSLYLDDDFSLIREKVCRGGRGKDGMQPLTFTPICEMNDEWLQAAIVYQEERGGGDSIHNQLYKMEQEYRKLNNIKVI
jgi:hypothetical protein